jgi:hypothetical protein
MLRNRRRAIDAPMAGSLGFEPRFVIFAETNLYYTGMYFVELNHYRPRASYPFCLLEHSNLFLNRIAFLRVGFEPTTTALMAVALPNELPRLMAEFFAETILQMYNGMSFFCYVSKSYLLL